MLPFLPISHLNSGLSKELEHIAVMPGASFVVKDHDFIWMWNELFLESRCVMFIKDFEYQPAPDVDFIRHPEIAEVDEFCSDNFLKCKMDSDVIDKVAKRKCIVRMNYKQNLNDYRCEERLLDSEYGDPSPLGAMCAGS